VGKEIHREGKREETGAKATKGSTKLQVLTSRAPSKAGSGGLSGKKATIRRGELPPTCRGREQP